jgi:hypothetical protein
MAKIITVPTPCHENWNDMTPKDQGRHCGSCCKTVVDFTNWQPQDILLHFKANKNVCGRFSAEQLNEPIPTQEDFVRQISYFAIPTIKKMAAIFLFAFMIGASSCGQKSTAAVTNTTITDNGIVVTDTTTKPPVNVIAGEAIAYPVEDTTKKTTPHKTMGKPKTTKVKAGQSPKAPVVVAPPPPPPMLMGDIAVVDTTTTPQPQCTNDPKKILYPVMGKMVVKKTPTTKEQ